MPPRITVITPVFNEEASLPEYERVVTAVLLESDEFEFEVLFVDDGSSDRSWQIIEEICHRHPRFQAIRLSRNYGAHVAISAGFAHATGDAVATLACDLQDPPETVLDLARRWQQGADIVWAHRRSRDEPWGRTLTSRLFEGLIRRFAMPSDSQFSVGSFLLVDRVVADCFRQFQEHNRVTFALVAWTGFSQAVVEYDRRARRAGVSGWTFRRMVTTMYDTFIGFSFLPIRLMTLAGVLLFLLTVPLAAYLVLLYFMRQPMLGWTSLMLVVTLFFGMQFLLLGIVGEYLYRIYAEVVRRPLYFVSDRTWPASDVSAVGDVRRVDTIRLKPESTHNRALSG